MKRWIPVWLLLSLLLCACGTVSPAPAEESSTPSVHEAPVPEVTKAPTPVPVVIRDALYESGSYSDNLGNSWDYVLRIPMIETAGEDAARLNRELFAALDPAVKEAQSSMADGCSLIVSRVDYTVYVNGQLISILCETDTDWGFESYYTVNYDASTHSEVNRTELLLRYGMQEEDFLAKAKALVEVYFQEHYSTLPRDDFYHDRHDRSVDAQNFKEDCCLFVNDSGQLCMIPKLYSFAGGDYYYHIFALNGSL